MRALPLGALCGALLASCTSPSEPLLPPNVLIVCVDAMRPDRLGIYGGGSGTSPNLDALAPESVVFEQAMSVASWTKPSVASLLTGLYPSQHQVLLANSLLVDTLPDEVVTLAERLAAVGYQTAAFVDNDHLLARSSNFDQGFEIYREDIEGASRLVHLFLTWVETTKVEPFFAYVHVLDPHWPYNPDIPDPFAGLPPADRLQVLHWGLTSPQWWLLREQINRGLLTLTLDELEILKKLYDGEIFATDAVLGRLFRLLADDGLLDRTLLLITSDHGEGFLEHGKLDHGYGLYDELLRIPLVVRFPRAKYAGMRVSAPVQSVDLVPTILELVGLAPAGPVGGRSLLPLLAHPQEAAQRVAFAEESYGHTQVVTLRSSSRRYIRTERLTSNAKISPLTIPSDLVPGIRVQVEGIFAAGEVVGSQVKQVGNEDQDHEVSGPVAAVDPARETLELLGIEVEIDRRTRLRDERGSFALSDLQPLQWVRAQGDIRDRKMQATKIARIFDTFAQEIEMEGIVDAFGETNRGEVWLKLCDHTIRLDRGARWKNFGAERRALHSTFHPAEGIRPPIVEELYDLRSDPTEQRNLAPQEIAILDEMRERLEERRSRLATADGPSFSAALDPSTRERLRLLGYLREDVP